jgi:hypothetical protein
MTSHRDWRNISPQEAALITAILSRSEVPGTLALIGELEGAVVTHEAQWVLDIKPARLSPGVSIQDGPFPTHATASHAGSYQGEILVWIKDGHLGGLEFAWITDDPPTQWPRLEDIDIEQH